jgi:hypothetical protein
MNDLRVNYFNTVGWDSRLVLDFYHNDRISGLWKVRYLWNMLLRRRVVSVQADEPICGARLMNFDMEELMAVSPEKRMAKFWPMHGDQIHLQFCLFLGRGSISRASLGPHLEFSHAKLQDLIFSTRELLRMMDCA